MTILVYVLAAVTTARMAYLLDLAHGKPDDVSGIVAAALFGTMWPVVIVVAVWDGTVLRARRAKGKR